METSSVSTRLAKRIQSVAPSATLAIAAKAKELAKKGINVISFSAGEPDFDTPISVKNKAIESLNKGFTKYTPSSGIPELRKAIADKLAKENGLRYEPNQIIVSCGAKHSLYNVIQVLIEEGDEVLFQSPYWLSYPEMVTLAQGKSVVIPSTRESGYKFLIEDLQKAVTSRSKLLILNSPSNPTGAVYTEQELRAIAKVCVKHSIYVLSDEIYEKLVFDGIKHHSIGAFGDDILNLTITVNGASKAYAMTGWRLGFAACPKDIAEAIDSLQSHSTSNPTSFAQIGYLEALANTAAEVEKMRQSFECRRNLIVDMVSQIPKVKCFRPQGAFYLYCDISETGFTSMQLTIKLLEEASVAVVPCGPFGDDQAIRLSYATSEANIREGISRIQKWLAAH